MKSMYLLILAIAISLILNSCGDIVNSESNTNTTTLEYNYVKEDQANAVIIPLKAGNVWYYTVTDLGSDGSSTNTYTDSIKVIRELHINDEKWFEVHFPLISRDKNIYMTNTDMGLQYKCMECSNKKEYLEAKYPEINNTFYSSSFKTDSVIGGHGNIKSYSDTYIVWKTSLYEQTTVPAGTFNCIRYNGWIENSNHSIKGYPYTTAWYAPDSGLVRAVIYTFADSGAMKVYQLAKKSELSGGKITQLIFDIEFGETEISTSKIDVVGSIFSNETGEPLIINSIEISPIQNEFSTVHVTTPIIIYPGNYFNFSAQFAPATLGEKTADIIFHTNFGDYTVKAHGIGI